MLEIDVDKMRLMAKMKRMQETLEECRDYFEERADAEFFTDSSRPIVNEEMRLLNEISSALSPNRP